MSKTSSYSSGTKIRIKATHRKLDELVESLDDFTIQIPIFQRNFVWNLKQSAKLLDSIIKGYPIGSLILWETKEDLRRAETDGFPTGNIKDGHNYNYVLDGQQRVASIYFVIKGIKRKGKGDNYSTIGILDKGNEEKDIVIVLNKEQIKSGNFTSIQDLFSTNYKGNLTEYRDRLRGYTIPAADLIGTEMDETVQMFIRINTSGTKLGIFDVMCAKTYEKGKFDLRKKWNELEKELKNRGQVIYDLFPVNILRAVSLTFHRESTDKAMLDANKKDFIDNWDKIKQAVFDTVQLFRGYGVLSIDDVPYGPLHVLFICMHLRMKIEESEGVSKNKNLNFSENKKLEEFFWGASFSERYNQAVNSKTKSDREVIDNIVKNPEYDLKKAFQSDFFGDLLKPAKIESFSKNGAFGKAVLCILAELVPRSPRDGRKVETDRGNVTDKKSQNLHHFFPKKYLKGTRLPPKLDDSIGNIIFLDKQSNTKIGAKGPRKYLGDYVKHLGEDKLQERLDTHLIDLIYLEKEKKDGLLNYEETQEGIKKAYEKFLNNRCKRISDEIKKLIPSLLDEENTQPTT